MESNLSYVRPVSPVAPYIGGKKILSARLCELISETPHRTYVEPFVGMGGVFLRRCRRPVAEVMNDISGDVACLYRILQRHYQAFMDLLKWQITSRTEFERLIRVDPATLTDLERAARFLYLQRLAFGGKVRGRSFGVARDTPARFDVMKLAPILEDVHERLSGVVIEQLPYADVISRYDGPDTLFYLDPPYWDCEKDYGPDVFVKADFDRLAAQLGGLSGHFILSINDTPGARAAFAAFHIEAVDVTYTIASGGAQIAGELIIRDYLPDPHRLL